MLLLTAMTVPWVTRPSSMPRPPLEAHM